MRRPGRTCVCWSLAVSVLLWPERSARAWENHTPGALRALERVPSLRDARAVRFEPFDSLLQAEQDGLTDLLAAEQTWALQNVPTWPVLPEALAFRPGDSSRLRDGFLRALRVDPQMKIADFVQTVPGGPVVEGPAIAWQETTLMTDPSTVSHNAYVRVEPGEEIPALVVVSSAADEPDYGLDIGVWEDNATAWGPTYGLGTQPFGNPRLEFSSQGPFHMGFFHEAGIVYKAASFLRRTYPEERIHLFASLSRFAFEKGHPYWGYRFLGWGVHYVEDLTEPYHARVLPGVSTLRMLWINTKAILGWPKSKEDAVSLVSNRHLALEQAAYEYVNRSHDLQATDPVLGAFDDTGADPVFDMTVVRGALTKSSVAKANRADQMVSEALPRAMVSDPAVNFGDGPQDRHLLAVLAADPSNVADRFVNLVVDLHRSFGAYTRAYARWVLGGR
jgi:hypothetical protein